MGEGAFNLRPTDSGLEITGKRLNQLDSDQESAWDIISLDRHRLLLYTKSSAREMTGREAGVAKLSQTVFVAMLRGLCASGFSGVISVDTGRGIKKLYLRDGQLRFAASNLIDDRLGEVIYRAGIIDLEQMTDSAVQVTRDNKFGKVLMSSGILNAIDLWEALKLQVLEIFRSLFLVNQVYVQIDEDGQPPTAVVYDRRPEDLIEESANFGRMFRGFLLQLSEQTTLEVNEENARQEGPPTFEKDMLQLIRTHQQVDEIISHSKLKDINTYRAMFQLVNRGLCRIVNPVEAEEDFYLAGQSTGIRSRIDAYNLLMRTVRDIFAEQKLDLPMDLLQRFVAGLNTSDRVVLFVDDEGMIPRQCVLNLYADCGGSRTTSERVEAKLSGMVYFLLQLAGDLLPWEQSRSLKKQVLEFLP